MATASAPAGYKPRLKQAYLDTIHPALKSSLSSSTKEGGEINAIPLNAMAVPRLVKIVVNMGVGEAVKESKVLDEALGELRTITGQKPMVTKARTSIAGFKLREGQSIGAKVTLRGDRMWEFLDRLLSVALPRIRDFRGLNPKAFDGRGNYTFGVTEQLIFPEIDYDKIGQVRGMDITIVTTATDDASGRALLKALGFPFRTT